MQSGHVLCFWPSASQVVMQAWSKMWLQGFMRTGLVMGS